MKTYAWYYADKVLSERVAKGLPELDLSLVILDFLLPMVCKHIPPEEVVCAVPLAPYTRPVTIKEQGDLEQRRQLLRRCKRIIVPSNYSYVQVSHWLDRKDLDVVPYSTTLDVVADTINVPRVGPQVLFVGRMVDKKGSGEFQEICKRVSLERPVQMVMTSRWNSLGGEQEELAKFVMMKMSRVGVLPSREEGFCYVPGELAVCGTVPIITSIPPNIELYPEFPMYPAGDILAAKSLTTRAMQGEFDEMLPVWGEFVRKNYGVEAQVARMVDYLRSIK